MTTTDASLRMEKERSHVADNLGSGLEQAREGLTDLNSKVVGFIRENPGTCLLGALAFGFVVGKLASRR